MCNYFVESNVERCSFRNKIQIMSCIYPKLNSPHKNKDEIPIAILQKHNYICTNVHLIPIH